MKAAWPMVPLAAVCDRLVDGDWIETKDQGGSDYRLLQVSNVGVGTFRETGNFRWITQETFDRLRCSQINIGDILIARMPDPTGRAWYVSDLPWPAVTAVDVAIATPNLEVVDGRFLAYHLNSPSQLGAVAANATGTTRLRITRRVLAGMPVPLPPLPIQRRIAALLATYDELIENNLRRIEILEEMARALYREWFVEFRFPGHEDVNMVDSELGPIPRDWSVSTLAGAAKSLVDGDWIETKDQGGSDYRLLQVSNIGLGRFRETGNFRYITKETFQRLRCTEIQPGDILISRMPDPVGRSWLVSDLQEPAITAVDVAILTPNTPAEGSYLVQFLNSPDTLARVASVSTGTTRLRVSRRVLGQVSVTLPATRVLDQFHEVVSTMTSLRDLLERQNTSLRATRELLLPKLVSGEIDVSDLDIDTDWLVA